jgi:hypothetical protein
MGESGHLLGWGVSLVADDADFEPATLMTSRRHEITSNCSGVDGSRWLNNQSGLIAWYPYLDWNAP